MPSWFHRLFLHTVHEPEVQSALADAEQYEVHLTFQQQAWNPAARPFSGSPFVGPGSVVYRRTADGSITASFRPPVRNRRAE